MIKARLPLVARDEHRSTRPHRSFECAVFPERWLLRVARFAANCFEMWPLGDRRGACSSNSVSLTVPVSSGSVGDCPVRCVCSPEFAGTIFSCSTSTTEARLAASSSSIVFAGAGITWASGIVSRTWEGDGLGSLACSTVADDSDAGTLSIASLTAGIWSTAASFAEVCKVESAGSSNTSFREISPYLVDARGGVIETLMSA